MPTTPTWALPYPSLADQPDGPAQIGALALATDSALTTINAGATTSATTLAANWNLISGRVVSSSNNFHDDIANVETSIPKLATVVTAPIGQWLRFNARLLIANPTVAMDDFVIRVRRGTTGGTVVATHPNFVIRTLVDHVFVLDHVWQADSAVNSETFHVSLQRVAGTGVVDVVGNMLTSFYVYSANNTRHTIVP